MEQRCPTRKHMKLKLIFKHRGFMKILSSSQNPGPASPVYLRFQTILPVHFLDFLIISMYGKKPVPRTLLNKPYTSQVPHQTSHILHTCPWQERGSRSLCTALQEDWNCGTLNTGKFATVQSRQASRTLLPNTSNVLFGISCTLHYKVVCCLHSHRIPMKRLGLSVIV